MCESLQSISICSPVKQPNVKHRLSDKLSEEEESSEAESSVTWKRPRVICQEDSEDDDLPETSQTSVAEPLERLLSSKKKSNKKEKKAKKH